MPETGARFGEARKRDVSVPRMMFSVRSQTSHAVYVMVVEFHSKASPSWMRRLSGNTTNHGQSRREHSPGDSIKASVYQIITRASSS